MHIAIRNFAPTCLIAAGLALALAPASFAQDSAPQKSSYPQYMYLSTTVIRPGMMHAYLTEDAKSAAADKAANLPTHYSAWQAISGPESVTYVIEFNTFAELQKWHEAAMADTKTQDVQREVATAEASMMTSTTAAFFRLDTDQSSVDTTAGQDIFAEATYYHIRPGQEDNWNRLVVLYGKALRAAVPDAHWYVYDEMYGEGSGNTVLIVELMPSLQHVDAMSGEDAQLVKAVGKEQMQVLQALLGKVVSSSESNLYVMEKKISYPQPSAQ